MQRAQAGSEELGRPQLIQSMIDAMQVPDLRSKIIFTLSMLVIFRFVAHVPVPGVDTQALAQAFQSQALLGFLDLFSGGALANLSVAALGVYPYITASIVMQILVPVVPNLKALSQEGEYGRQRGDYRDYREYGDFGNASSGYSAGGEDRGVWVEREPSEPEGRAGRDPRKSGAVSLVDKEILCHRPCVAGPVGQEC